MGRRPLCSPTSRSTTRRSTPSRSAACSPPGLRKGEVGKLKPNQIEDRVKLLATQTKGKQERTVYADPDDQPALRDMRALVAANQLPRAYRMGRVLHKALVACGYQDLNVVVHSLRHTHGTRLLEKGVPPPIVQKIMGHKHIETTMRYCHASEAAAERAIHERWRRRESSE
jgi:integrase